MQWYDTKEYIADPTKEKGGLNDDITTTNSGYTDSQKTRPWQKYHKKWHIVAQKLFATKRSISGEQKSGTNQQRWQDPQ